MSETIKATYQDFNRQLQNVINMTKRGVQKELYFQGRLLAYELIESTPPRTKEHGEKAVSKDLNKLAMRFGKGFIDKIAAEHGLQNVNAYYGNVDTQRNNNYQFKQIDPSGSRMKEWHYSQRRGMRRNVGGKNRYRVFKGKNFKDVTLQADFAIAEEDYLTYKKYTMSKVGRQRAAWLRSYDYLIGMAPGGNRVAQWITRHRSCSPGQFLDRVMGGYDYMFLEMTNNAAGINEPFKGKQLNHVARWALKKRAVAIRNSISDMLRKQQTKQLGFNN